MTGYALRQSWLPIALSLIFAIPDGASAQNYPSRPITFVVPSTPGGVADGGARVIAKALGEKIKQVVLVENRPGAGGAVATEFVVKSRPDGYTMFYGNAASIVTNPVLYKNLTFDPRKDLAPVHGLQVTPPVLVINPKQPYKTLDELVAYAKANPYKINFASGGAGTTQHLAGELLQKLAGIKMTHVPYKGSIPAMTDVVSGVADLMFDYPVTIMPLVEAKKISALAVLSDRRLSIMPDTKTAVELGYQDLVLSAWSGLFVPAGTPRDVVAILGQAVGEALRDPALVKYFNDNGQGILSDMTPEKFAPFVAAEAPKWKDLVEMSGAKAY